MNPEILNSLIKASQTAGIIIFALWLFRDRIYFSFGQPPAGIRFRHPDDGTNGVAGGNSAPKA